MPTLTKLYSMEEASKHNTSDDCWIVIDGKVQHYSLLQFVVWRFLFPFQFSNLSVEVFVLLILCRDT